MTGITWTESDSKLSGSVNEKASITEIELDISKIPAAYSSYTNINIIFTNNAESSLEEAILSDLKIMFPSWSIKLKDHVITITVGENKNKL